MFLYNLDKENCEYLGINELWVWWRKNIIYNRCFCDKCNGKSYKNVGIFMGKGKKKYNLEKMFLWKKGWEKLCIYIGIDELWELESKK